MTQKPARRNPKKDKSARRPRPPRPIMGVGRIRMSMERVGAAILNAPADLAPILGCAGVWMYNGSEDGHAANHCIDAAMTMQYALEQFGIDSHPEPVRVALTGNGSKSIYGAEVPHWTDEGQFNGHVVLVMPEVGRFLDATLQQFREVPYSEYGEVPVLAKLPGGNTLGTAEFAIDRVDHGVVYVPVPGDHQQLWRHPTVENAREGYREAGINLAGNVFDLLRISDVRERTLTGPYPRLRHLVEVLGDAKSYGRDQTYYFTDPTTGRGVRLSEIQ